jgi:hypothetical protein
MCKLRTVLNGKRFTHLATSALNRSGRMTVVNAFEMSGWVRALWDLNGCANYRSFHGRSTECLRKPQT